jgi:hypothetical protein
MTSLSVLQDDSVHTTLLPPALAADVAVGSPYMLTVTPFQSYQVRITDSYGGDTLWINGPRTSSWVLTGVPLLVHVLSQVIPEVSETESQALLCRYYTGEVIPPTGTEADTFFTDRFIGGLVTEFKGNVLRVASRMWMMKAAEYGRLIDFDEAGTTRKMTQRYKQAKDLASDFEAAAQLYDEGQTGTVRVAGRAINLRHDFYSNWRVTGENFQSGLLVIEDAFYPSGVGRAGP